MIGTYQLRRSRCCRVSCYRRGRGATEDPWPSLRFLVVRCNGSRATRGTTGFCRKAHAPGNPSGSEAVRARCGAKLAESGRGEEAYGRTSEFSGHYADADICNGADRYIPIGKRTEPFWVIFRTC